MVELIRQDGNTCVKVLIEGGETTLGRGALLKIEATNVSRRHAKILVDDSNVVLTCLHKNPIMVKKDDWQELGKDEHIALHDMDEFKFLENNCHFKVLVREPNKSMFPSGIESNKSPVTKEGCPSTTTDSKKRKLPSWMDGSASSPVKIKRSPVEILSTDKENEAPACIVAAINVDKTDDESRREESYLPSPLNMIPSTSKTDSQTNSRDKGDFPASKSSDMEALVVNPDGEKSSDLIDYDGADKNIVGNSRSSKNSSSPVRSSCMFGSSCYRKNPAHRVKEAHPGDDDYVDPTDAPADEGDDRPECEFGTACYRKNPDHKRQFKHCNRPKRRAKENKKVKVAKKKKEIDDYDSGDSFIDDEEEDNWSPVDDSDDDEDWSPKLSQEDDE